MPEIRTSDHELCVCQGCGHEYVRARRERQGQVPCMKCHSIDVALYDALWVEQPVAVAVTAFLATHERIEEAA